MFYTAWYHLNRIFYFYYISELLEAYAESIFYVFNLYQQSFLIYLPWILQEGNTLRKSQVCYLFVNKILYTNNSSYPSSISFRHWTHYFSLFPWRYMKWEEIWKTEPLKEGCVWPGSISQTSLPQFLQLSHEIDKSRVTSVGIYQISS